MADRSTANYQDYAILHQPCPTCDAKPGEHCTSRGKRARLHVGRIDAALATCDHTPSPSGYLAFFDWAAAMNKTHKQTRCPGCGLWKVWVPRAAASEGSEGKQR